MTNTVSIIIPVYNKASYLADCVESIRALSMKVVSLEAIFINDGSTDESLSLLESLTRSLHFAKIINLTNNTGSPAQPRNIGIEAASGDYLTFLDADDRLDPEGFPELVKQAMEHDADIAFGQSIKHTDTSIQKVARFASFEVANELLPYAIDKIFRAVGPPGKLIKRSILMEHQIRFVSMPFAEDKLFFFEAISKCQTASMNPLPVYHINRFERNDSLVGRTSLFEKMSCNLQVLERTFALDIPKIAKTQAISRLVEMDFLSRLFNNQRFLDHPQKQEFFDVFQAMLSVFDRQHEDVTDYIEDETFRKQCRLLRQHDYDAFIAFTAILADGVKARRYMMDHQLFYRMPEALSHLEPVAEPFFAVYGGTHCVNETFYEVVHLYKEESISVNRVYLMKPQDETVETEVSFHLEGNDLFLLTEQLERCPYSFQLLLIYDDYKPFVVRMALPSAARELRLKRQQLKLEFQSGQATPSAERIDTTQYLHGILKYVVVIQQANLYADLEFQEKQMRLEAGQVIEITELKRTRAGTPRLVTIDGMYLTANKTYVHSLPAINQEKYLVKRPRQVRVLKSCKQYADRDFQHELPTRNRRHTMIAIEKIVLSSKGTPRLKTSTGAYMTANRDFVQPIKE